MADHDETDTNQSMKDEMGTKATITITTGPEGFDIGLDFHGEKMDQDPTAVQALAVVGLSAIKDAIRYHFNVTEEITHRKKRG